MVWVDAILDPFGKALFRFAEPMSSFSCLASTDNAHPLEVAWISDGLKTKPCGHNLQLKRLIQNSSTNCPVCQTSISLVQDSLAPSSTKTVFFKYGKFSYRLTVERPPPSFWSLSFWLGSSARTVTAQERIRFVFDMTDIRILSQGKVLYPSSSFNDIEVSKRLIEVSQNVSKPTLVVMGTKRGHELKAIPLHTTIFAFLWQTMNWIYRQATQRFILLIGRRPPPE